MMRKILIVYATAGTGHKKAALAIKKAFDEIAPKDIEVSIIDSLDYTNAFFKWIYLKIYLLMVNRFPLLWGIGYYLTDNRYINLAVLKIRRFNNWLNSQNFIKYLLDSKPDCILATHFFASEIVSDLKKSAILNSHLITIVTDYRLHAWWVSDHVDTYVVSNQDAKSDLIRWKIAPDKVKIVGIPVEPIFSKVLDKGKILEEVGFQKGIFTILIIGGGFGVGPIEDIVKIVADINREIQLIVICGHNEELFKRIEDLKFNLKIKIVALGFVDNVYDFMEISDILISKSGGITVTESLAKVLPMIIISPIIGQETRNSDFLVKNSAAIKVEEVSQLKPILEDLIAHPEKIEDMKRSINMIRKPYASYDIARLAMES